MRIAIIEDMPSDSEIIKMHLSTYFTKVSADNLLSIQTYESGESFLQTFIPNSFDLIFIDYYLKESLSGLETAYAIRMTDSTVSLIFVSVSSDFAVESYKTKASGYLVKPVTFQHLSELLSLIDFKSIRDKRYIEIVNGYHSVKIPLKDIIYCDNSGHYIQIHTNSMGLQRSRMSFARLCEMLSPYPEFILCYRGCLINLNHVSNMDKLVFFMDCGERIPFRKKDYHKMMDEYSKFLFDKVRKEKP